MSWVTLSLQGLFILMTVATLHSFFLLIYSIIWISTIYTFRLSDIGVVSSFDYYTQCHSECSCPCLPWVWVFLGYGKVGLLSHRYVISSNLLDNVKPFFQSCSAKLHSHLQRLKFCSTSDPCQHLELSHFLPVWGIYSLRNYMFITLLLSWFKALHRQHENSQRYAFPISVLSLSLNGPSQF